jgi:hypothetical protein
MNCLEEKKIVDQTTKVKTFKNHYIDLLKHTRWDKRKEKKFNFLN